MQDGSGASDSAGFLADSVLDTARQPFRSRTWIAALGVIVDRDGGDWPAPAASTPSASNTPSGV